MKLKTLILSLSLCSCEALPDEISVGGFTSEYDFLGANSLKGDGNETGNQQGVMVTATYKLKPQTIRLQNPIVIPPPPKFVEAPKIESFKFDQPILPEETDTSNLEICSYILTSLATLISCFGIRKFMSRRKKRKSK